MALPGVQTALRDQFYVLSRTGLPVGPRVLAIATRNTVNGTGSVADYDPYLATDEQSVIAAFGKGSGCHRAFLELVAASAPTVYIVAVAKDTSDTDLKSTSLNNALDQAMSAAETAQPDIIVLWGRGGHPTEWEVPATPGNEPQFGFYADDSSGAAAGSMAKRVSDWCQDISNRSHPVFGILGLKPFVNTANPSSLMTAAQIATHVTFPNLASRVDSTFGTNGMYLVVVGTEVTPVGYDTTFGYANGACTYAGAAVQMLSWSSPTGKLIFNISGVRYSPTRTQQQNLIDIGVNPVALNFARVPVWVESKTFAPDASDYSRVTTLRIVFDAMLLVRGIAQSFVGEAASLQNRNSLETAITSGLSSMQKQGALLASDFRVSYIPTQNQANVDLILTPAFEMRTIQVTVSVQLA